MKERYISTIPLPQCWPAKLRMILSEHGYFLVLLPFLLLIGYSLGFRPGHWGSDTNGYIGIFHKLKSLPDAYAHFEWLFIASMKGVIALTTSPHVYFTCLILVNFVLLVLNAALLSDYLWDSSLQQRFMIITCFACYVSPFFISGQINVIRQGTAFFFVLLFYLLLLKRHSPLWLLLVGTIAQGLHSTSIIFLVPAYGLLFSYRAVSRILTVLVVLYATGITPQMIKKFSQLSGLSIYDQIMSYGGNATYTRGLRYDFLLFTLVAGIAFDIFGRYFQPRAVQAKYFTILKIYWLLSLPFLLVGYGAYSDRFYLPCWTFLSFLCAIVLKNIDDTFKPSLFLWIFGLYGLGLLYFLLNWFHGV
ncbi:MAG: EpsG family protein [Legionellaceae bacterium]|nr:EpsG family protein [Legionellaceae bacterium]